MKTQILTSPTDLTRIVALVMNHQDINRVQVSLPDRDLTIEKRDEGDGPFIRVFYCRYVEVAETLLPEWCHLGDYIIQQEYTPEQITQLIRDDLNKKGLVYEPDSRRHSNGWIGTV